MVCQGEVNMTNEAFQKLVNPERVVIDKTKLNSYISQEPTWQERNLKEMEHCLDRIESLKNETRKAKLVVLLREIHKLGGIQNFSLDNYPGKLKHIRDD